MKIKPSRGKAFIRLHKEPEVTQGGILIPEAVRSEKSEGTVVAVGDGKVLDNGVVVPPPVAVEDVVILPKYGGSDVKLLGWEVEGEGRMVMIDTDDILGVIEA